MARRNLEVINIKLENVSYDFGSEKEFVRFIVILAEHCKGSTKYRNIADDSFYFGVKFPLTAEEFLVALDKLKYHIEQRMEVHCG